MLANSTFWQEFSLKLLIVSFSLHFLISECWGVADGEEGKILMQIKSTLERSNSFVFESWKQENAACDFTGIVCNSNQKVTEINLSSKNLSGSVAFDLICSLEWIEKIDLGSNSLYGSITDHLSNCTNLKFLNLGFNHFSGEVPSLSALNQLELLNLNKSGFSGSFPWKSLENLTSLRFLSLGDNLFHTSPFPTEVLRFDKLYWLYLTNCSIGGQIPEAIGNLTSLELLELSDNYLFGTIPDSITKLTKLTQLELYNNSLTGKIPVGFGNLTNLAYFDVSTNNLKGDLSELRSLKQLVSLQLFENQFSGEIPQEFGDLRYLEGFSVYTNKLTGSLPQKIGSWAQFQYIDVSENFLSGSIPPDMCKQGQLNDLLILQNKFTGGIPDTYANCSSLVRLRVSNNSLSGQVPSGIWSLPNLVIIDLNLNQFEGSVASTIGDAQSLAQLFLADNQFSGELPERISEATSLVIINIRSNKFSGEIPTKLGGLKKLISLHLEFNQFSGDIPDSLGSCVFLSDINLADNSLSGEIPSSLGSLKSLNFLNLSNNRLSGEIPVSLSSLRLNLLDLSNNRLVGEIPDAISIEAFNSSYGGNQGLCSESSISGVGPCSSVTGKSKDIKTVISCFIAGAGILVVAATCFLCVKFRQNDQEKPIKKVDSWNMRQFHVVSFSEEHILKALKQENVIGKGGSGNVYKVVLDNGKQLAVKHIWNSDTGHQKSCQSSSAILVKDKVRSKEYEAEVATLSSVRHVNVVKLYCSITSEDSNLLVYEYLPNGSLWDWLHTGKKNKTDWIIRYEIALGAARGLEYLHHGCHRPILHRDVKSSNILLDAEIKPRIADFGLAKILWANSSSESTHVIAGTPGYMAPGKCVPFTVSLT